MHVDAGNIMIRDVNSSKYQWDWGQVVGVWCLQTLAEHLDKPGIEM